MSEDPFDDWETAADAGLNDFEENNKKPTSNKALQQKATAAAAATPIIIHTNTESSYTHYKPEIKILKRPDHAKSRFQSRQNESGQQRPTHKSLAEKEKAYEEARRRLFNT